MKRLIKYLLLLFWLPAFPQLNLAEIFSDNMVIQQNEPIRFWGTSNMGATLNISFANTTKITNSDSFGNWMVEFAPQVASMRPYELNIKSDNDSITLKNILIGEVWLLLGQSNMEWPMISELYHEEARLKADNPHLRFFNPSYVGKNIYAQLYSEEQLNRLESGELFDKVDWVLSDEESFKSMSAVGYYFGNEILDSENIPVGLINLSIGGAPIETFINPETFKKEEKFTSKLSLNWLENDNLPVWIRERGEENLGANQITKNHMYRPGYVYTSGISKIIKMPIRGILWYQGESNAQERQRVNEYPQLQKLLIDDYREQWEYSDLPFYWVQLSSIDTTNYNSHLWPEFRDGQRRLMYNLDNGGMVVSSDKGEKNDIHPRNKKVIGERLARWALRDIYNKDIVASGPLPLKAYFQQNRVIIEFEHTAEGLQTDDALDLKGFSIPGHSNIEAKINKSKVVIPTNSKPEWIFYNWQPYAVGNLINSEGLPASTFKIKVQ